MATLTHITFTGVDERTDIGRLLDIQARYPRAEFGMLIAAEPTKRPNRYPDPRGAMARRLLDSVQKGVNLSAHLCGGLAREAASRNWDDVYRFCPGFPSFRRCQLNIARLKDVEGPVGHFAPPTLDELIIQQYGADKCDALLAIPNKYRRGVLLDASGGKGIYADPAILEGPYHVGYAGGLNADNVRAFVDTLMNDPRVGAFWIDMETGVRTSDDWLDLDKVEAVLDTVQDIILHG